LADGWCEGCGKKIPNHVLFAADKAPRRHRVQAGEETVLHTATGRPTLAGYLVILLFLGIGAVFTLALANGRVAWVWLGCAVGAVVGVGAAQAFGLWPSRRS
jgi:hypothetical protein